MDLQKRARNYGIDLLRIVSMIMIVVLHILGQGGILSSCTARSFKYEMAWFLEIAAYCAVNCYALISGYVGVESKKYKYSNIAALWLQVVFYTVLITILFAVFMPEADIGKKVFLKAFFPVMSKQYWYFSAYFCIFFFFPVFNFVLNTMPKKQLTAFTVTAVVILSLLPTAFSVFPKIFHSDPFLTSSGYSVLWLTVLYMLGGYIKKFGVLIKKLSVFLSFAVYLACIAVTWLSKFAIERLPDRSSWNLFAEKFLIKYTSPFMLLAAVALLCAFSKMNVSRLKKVIAFMSPLSFSVYIIHVHPLIWEHVIKDRFASYAEFSATGMVFAVIFTAIGIYLVCSLADYIRSFIFKVLRIKELLSSAEKRWIKNPWNPPEGIDQPVRDACEKT